MFDLSIPWWQFAVRGLIVYAALMVLIRLSGKRTVGEFTPFDLIVVILIGESTQGALTGGDQSVIGALIVAATLIAADWAIGYVSARSPRFDKLLAGEPVMIVRNGVRLDRAMKRCNLPVADLDEAVRREGHENLDDVAFAMLETNGDITVVPKSKKP